MAENEIKDEIKKLNDNQKTIIKKLERLEKKFYEFYGSTRDQFIIVKEGFVEVKRDIFDVFQELDNYLER